MAGVGVARAADVEIATNTSTLVNLDGFSGATAHVATGVTVNPSPGSAISATIQSWILTNDGNLSGANTVRFTKGGSITNDQGASIASTTSAVILGTAGVGGLGTVVNGGTITGGTSGDTVALNGGGSVTNLSTGTISATNTSNAVSISGGTSRTVTNDGLISNAGSSFATGILIQGAGATNTITNNASGRIVGGYNGIFASATAALTLYNDGSITSTRGSAVEATLGGTLSNRGTIASTNSNGILVRNTASAEVVNSGTITGAVNAINFTATGGGSTGAAHTVRLLTGSVLNGNVLGGTGTDSLILNGTGTESIAKFSGFEIMSMQGGSWTATGTGAFASGTTVGSGTLRVSGQLTSSSVTVNGGTLAVDGIVIASSGITVNAGGTLGGIGTVSQTTINAGGSLAPGNSIGTITVNGRLALAGSSNYVVEVAPGAADRTNVTGAPGTATLAGTLRAVGTGGAYTVGTRYTVLNAAGGISGTFGTLDVSGNFGATKPVIEYDTNDVYLMLVANAISPLLAGGTPNQRAVAGAVDAALAAGIQAAPFGALFGLSAAQLPAGLDALSGEVHVSTAGALADESQHVRSAILGRLRQTGHSGDAGMASLSFGGPLAFANAESGAPAAALAFAPSVATKAHLRAPEASRDVVFWAQSFGAWGRFGSDGNAATLRRELAGFISGVDTRIGSNGRVGVAAGYSSARQSLDDRGAANVESAHIAGYGGYSVGAFNLRGGAAYAFHAIDTDRAIAMPGFLDRATASYGGHTGQVFGEIGYGLAFGALAAEPFAGVAWVRVETDPAAERGGAAALNLAGTSFEAGYSSLGLRAAGLVPAGEFVLMPRGALAWQHAFTATTPTGVLAFQGAPAAPFTIAGVPIARDALLAEAGLDLALNRTATIGVSYTGQIAGNVQEHAAKGRFNWKF